MTRAYCTLQVTKATDSGGRRIFQGTASTPEVDNVGDIVEPRGMQISVPCPLLWQHDARDPIGWVTEAKVSDSGVAVTCEVAMLTEPASLRERLDSAWQMLRSGLVRGLSIGFQGLETARIEPGYGVRYIRSRLLELSAVTIPANGSASISAIKSADAALRRAQGSRGPGGGRGVVHLDGAPARKHGVVYLDPTTAPKRGVVYLKR